MDLTTMLCGLRLVNPLMAASGCFGYGVEYGDTVDLSSLGAIVVKGLFLTEREGSHRLKVCVENQDRCFHFCA